MRKWQRTFFYVRNSDPERDGLNLPVLALAPPSARQNWFADARARGADTEIECVFARMRHLQASEGLVAADLVASFIARRVQPLQKRSHWMCDVSFRRDPTRTSTSDMTPQQVVQRVNAIADFKLPDYWWFGMEPYCRNLPAPKVCVRPDMRYCSRSRRYNPDPGTKHISVPPRHMTLPYASDFQHDITTLQLQGYNISYNRHTTALKQVQQRKIHV